MVNGLKHQEELDIKILEKGSLHGEKSQTHMEWRL